MTLPPNVSVSTKVTRWRKEIVRYTIGVTSNSSGRDVVTCDIKGPFEYETWNTQAIEMLNLANVFNQEGIEDARAMTADEIQKYVKKEEDKKIHWDNISMATEDEIEEYLTRTNRQIDIDDVIQELRNGDIVKIDHVKNVMQVKYHNPQ